MLSSVQLPSPWYWQRFLGSTCLEIRQESIAFGGHGLADGRSNLVCARQKL